MSAPHDARPGAAASPSSPPVAPGASTTSASPADGDAARPVIEVTGVVLRRASDGCVLTVRKRGTRMFMFPGGKPEAGENPVETGIREVREELGIELRAGDLEPVGEWHSDAANEPGHGLHSHVFMSTVALTATPTPASEIEELRWQPLDGVEEVEDLAPLSRWFALPAVRAGEN